MKQIDTYITEKLHLTVGRKMAIDNRKDLLAAFNEYFSTAFKKDMPKIMEHLEKWIDEFGPSEFKIVVDDWNKDFKSKYLAKWDINKYIEFVNLDNFSHFRRDNIQLGLENAEYNHEYHKRKYISLQLGEKAAYIETYELSVLIVLKDTEIK